MSRASEQIDRLLARHPDTTRRLALLASDRVKWRAYQAWLEAEAHAIDRLYPPDDPPCRD